MVNILVDLITIVCKSFGTKKNFLPYWKSIMFMQLLDITDAQRKPAIIYTRTIISSLIELLNEVSFTHTKISNRCFGVVDVTGMEHRGLPRINVCMQGEVQRNIKEVKQQ